MPAWTEPLAAARRTSHRVEALWTRLREPQATTSRTPFHVIAAEGLMQTWRFVPTAPRRFEHPVVLVPPLMARSFVFDLHPARSLVRFLSDLGFAVYLVDWGDPKPEHRDLSVEDYALDWLPVALDAVRDDAGAAPFLVGYCLGGLFCCWTLALNESFADIPGLALIASPTDARRMGPLVGLGRHAWKPADLFGRTIGNIPGSLTSAAFQLTAPARVVTRWLRFIAHASDDAFVDEFAAMRGWMRDFAALPHGIYHQLLFDLIRDNRPFRGTLELRGNRVDLGRLQLPILAIGGASDRIVAPPSVHAITEVVGSREVECVTASGGHAGVLAGSRSRAETWTPVADFLTRRALAARR